MLNPPSGITETQYKNAIMNGNPTHAKIEFTSQGKTFTDDDIYIDGGITVRTVAAVEEQFRVGCVITTEVTINFIYGSNFSDLDWTGEFELSFGVEINSVTQWVPIGIFSGKKPKRNIFSDIVEFTATDRISKFNGLADDFLAQCQSNTVRTLFNEMCTYFGFSAIVHDARSNPGLDMVIDVQSVFQKGITCRKMLEIMAEATGTIVKARYDGTIVLCWPMLYTAGVAPLFNDQFFDLEIIDVEVHENDCVYLAKSTDSANGLLYPPGGTNPYIIYDNPILLNASQADQESMITKILSNLEHVYYTGAYRPGSVEAIGNWLVEVVDIVNVRPTVSISPSYNLCVCNRTLHWNGSVTDIYECTGSDDENDLLTPEAKGDYEFNNKIEEVNNNLSEDIATRLRQVIYTGDNKISDLDNIEVGTWGRVTVTSAVSPTGSELTGNFICAGNNAGYRTITIWGNSSVFFNTCYAGTWQGWNQMLTGDRFISLSVASTGNTFTLENSSRIGIDIIAAANSRNGQMSIYVTASGTVYYNVSGASGLTISATTNKITITGGTCTLYCRVYAGSITKDAES